MNYYCHSLCLFSLLHCTVHLNVKMSTTVRLTRVCTEAAPLPATPHIRAPVNRDTLDQTAAHVGFSG